MTKQQNKTVKLGESTWTAHYPRCSSCGEEMTYPITSEWWWEHTSPWHAIKWWFKRRGKTNLKGTPDDPR